MADLTRCNAELDELLSCVESPKVAGADEELFCGLDVGTAFIVLVAVDGEGHPRGCAYQFADVVRDGMVVDYMGACDIARSLCEKLESQLGCELSQCAVALPPGTEGLDGGVVKNVAESAGLDVTAVFDEPTAANFLIGATDAAVVDIGAGIGERVLVTCGSAAYHFVRDEFGKNAPVDAVIVGIIDEDVEL